MVRVFPMVLPERRLKLSLTFGHVIKMLDNTTERVTMSGNNHALSRLDFWNDDVIPVWESTFDCKFKRFASWKFISWNISIKWILNYFLVLVQF